MRRFLVAFGLAAALAAPAAAQPGPPAARPEPPAAPTPPAPDPDNDEPPPAPRTMRQPEQLDYKPSGFRMSNVPAKGGAYRYRLMIVGALTVALTALLVARYLRKVNRARP